MLYSNFDFTLRVVSQNRFKVAIFAKMEDFFNFEPVLGLNDYSRVPNKHPGHLSLMRIFFPLNTQSKDTFY